jgi:hypothetical protein
MAAEDRTDRWAKASLRYATAVTARPGKVVACGWLFPLAFFAAVWLTFGSPYIGTDFSAYLKKEGTVADNNDAFEAAVKHQSKSEKHGDERRLEEAFAFPFVGANVPEDRADELDDVLAAENALFPQTTPESGRSLNGELPKADYLQQRNAEWFLSLYFRESNSSGLPTGANILTDRYIKQIRHVENKIAALPQMNDFCFIQMGGQAAHQEGSCRRPISFTNFVFSKMTPRDQKIDATHRIDREIYPYGEVERPLPVKMVAAKLAEKEGTWYFTQNFPKDKTSSVLRVRFYFGLPLKGFESREDQYEEQQRLFRAWATDVLLPYLETASSESLQVIYVEDSIRREEIRKVVVSDGTFAFGSFVFIISVSAFQMRSVAIPLAGVVTIAMSLPLAFAVFRLLFERFSIINIVAFYLILGIGADNLYVIEAYWKTYKHRSETQRLAATIYAGGRAIFVASITTAFSVFANCISPIYPVKTFGAFMGLCVVCNLALTFIVFPAVLVLTERRFEERLTPDLAAVLPSGSRPHSSSRIVGHQTGWASLAEKLKTSRNGIILLGLVFSFSAFIAAAINTDVAEEPPRFFEPGSHNLGDLQEVEVEYNNRSRWQKHLETQPLLICRGCVWSDTAESFESCDFIGADCSTPQCNAVRGEYRCHNRGECQPDGTCRCLKGYSGEDCRTSTTPNLAGAADQACDASSPNVCSGNGYCYLGQCWCYSGYAGRVCSILLNPDDLSEEACVHGPWSDWGPCQKPCGESLQVRTKKTPNGCSPPVTESQTCYSSPCCRTSVWSDWFECMNCDERVRARTFLDAAAANAAKCDFVRLQDTEDCSFECTECATTEWVPQDDCSASCGYGTRKESRTVALSSASQPCAAVPSSREGPCFAGRERWGM